MSKSYRDIPFVGSLSALLGESGDYSGAMARLAEEHGPLFTWTPDSGGAPRISMVGPEANRFVMHTHRDHFSHDLGWTPIIGDMFGKGLLNMDDPEHAVHRKMWNPLFAGAYMGTYLPIMQRVIEEHTARWPSQPAIDLSHEAREITFDIAAAALAGFGRGEQVSRLREHFYMLLHGFEEDAESFDDYFARVQRVQNEMVGMLLAMIHERRNTSPQERHSDVLSAIVHARDENGQALNDAQVLSHLMILLVAGHETTTSLAAWGIYLLAAMPEYREQLLAELEGVPADSPISMEAIRGLKQMDYFVREVGRLYPPVINVPRGVLKEFEFAGYTVPAGVMVRLGLGPTHRLSSAFQDPDRFDPSRFAPPREEDKRTPYSLVTFGGGPRVCIGQHFALVEVKALLAHVLRHYTVQPVEGRRPVHTGFFNAYMPGGVWAKVK